MGPRDHYWKVLRRLDLLYNVGGDGLNQSMTIWSVDNHVRHPWFDSAVKKRKHVPLDSGCSTSSDESDAAERRPSKRRRCSILEQGLAHLSLQHNPSKNSTWSQDDEQWSEKREPTITELPQEEVAMDADDEMDGQTLAREPMLLPSSVEEPEPDIPEIQMKASSWYELAPDREYTMTIQLFIWLGLPTIKSQELSLPTLIRSSRRTTMKAITRAPVRIQ